MSNVKIWKRETMEFLKKKNTAPTLDSVLFQVFHYVHIFGVVHVLKIVCNLWGLLIFKKRDGYVKGWIKCQEEHH